MTSLNKEQIKKYIPHREPFLFIDELIDIKKLTKATGVKIFTNNDECINLWNGMIEATWEDYNNEQQKIRNYFPIKYTSQCFSNLPSLVGTLDGIYYLAGNKIKCKP